MIELCYQNSSRPETNTESTHDGPDQLEQALAGLTEASLDLALANDAWSIRQIVHHVVDGDDVYKTCIQAALGEGRGLFSLGWCWEKPQDAWAEDWNYAGREIEPSLALLRANRAHTTQLLEHNPGAWERCALITLPDGKKESTFVGYVIEMQAKHLAGHVKDIREIRQARESLR